MMENIQKTLEELGLNSVEAKIYISLITIGKGTVSDISKESGLKRPTIYQYIDDLSTKDLIRKTFKGKRMVYFPSDPEKIIALAGRLEKKARDIFPHLESMFGRSSSKPAIRFYEGKEALRSVYREMTNTSKMLWSLFAAERYFKVFSEKDGNEFLDNVYKNGGEIRDLVLRTPAGVEYVKEDWGGEVTKSKLLPKDFESSVDLLVTGDKFAMISFDSMVAVVIENQEIANIQTQLMKFLWASI